MNYGVILGYGSIIGIINSDDIYQPDAISIVKKYFANNPKSSFLFGTVERNYLGQNKILKSGFFKLDTFFHSIIIKSIIGSHKKNIY